MTSREDIINLCLDYSDAYLDYPFKKTGGDYCVVRHKANTKIFALIFTKDEKIWVNLKTDPIEGDFLKQVHASVLPGYHMNKQHWISVILDDTITDDEIASFVECSFRLTADKTKKKS